jgi:hypothetical protein
MNSFEAQSVAPGRIRRPPPDTIIPYSEIERGIRGSQRARAPLGRGVFVGLVSSGHRGGRLPPFIWRIVAWFIGGLSAASVPLMLHAAASDDPGVSFASHTGVINASKGVAIKGYDPVAYFTDRRAMPGDPSITANVDGVIWRFESQMHRQAFLDHPNRYEPEYGGFSAYGLAQGYKADIDPTAFSIIGGRLYLNTDIETRSVWRRNLLTAIADADRNWPAVKDAPPVGG